jgi:hypothetical protein
MDNENTYSISLGSRLDINSHDMLVPVSAPTFQFNRQKYIGSLLQTSVRYEADGWFAGWWGHNFELEDTSDSYITPALGDPEMLSIIKRLDDNYKYVWQIKHKDVGLTYTFSPELYEDWQIGSGDIKRITDKFIPGTNINDYIDITNGKTSPDKNNFSIQLDPYSGEVYMFTDLDNIGLIYSVSKEASNIRLEIKRDEAFSEIDYVKIRVNNSPTLGSSVLSAYTYNLNGLFFSTWDNLFELKVVSASNFTLNSKNNNFRVVAGTVVLSGYNTELEKVTADIRDLTINNLNYEFIYKSYWVDDLFSQASPLSADISAQVVTNENKMSADILSRGKDELVYNNSCIFRYSLPIWLQHRLEFDYSVQFAEIGLPEHIKNFTWVIKTIASDGSETPTPIEINGFFDLLTGADLTIYCFITEANSPYKPATRFSKGVYKIVQPDNPRYCILSLNIQDKLRNENLFIPTTFQPYSYNTNPDYDPRPLVWSGEDELQIYGLTQVSKAEVEEKNPDKYEEATNVDTIAEMVAIPDSRLIDPFVPEYAHTYGEIGDDVINNYKYQPDPLAAYYDPRPVVHAINGVLDPDVKDWVDGEAAIDNTAQDPNWGIKLEPEQINYTRYWLNTPKIWQIDWEQIQRDAIEFWEAYWPDIDRPIVPIPAIDAVSPYDVATVSGVVSVIIEVTTSPDTTLAEYQPQDKAGEFLPPMEKPYIAQLRLGNFVKKSVLHAMKDISEVVNWSWAFTLVRYNYLITYVPWGIYNQSYYTYFDSDMRQVGADTVVWKPITENFIGTTVYARNLSAVTNNRTGWFSATTYTGIQDSWILHFKCKNGRASFPIPITDFNNTDKDGSNYFSVQVHCDGIFRDNQILMQRTTHALWTIPRYTDPPYSDNYRVLNEINLTRAQSKLDSTTGVVTYPAVDDGIFTGDKAKGIINVPICVPGYAVSEITTPAILRSSLDAFALKNNISNQSAEQLMWRIDNAESPYNLNLATAELLSIQPSSKSLYVKYNWANGTFYKLKKVPYTEDNASGTISGFQNYAYPEWIRRNLAISPMGSYNENDWCGTFILGDSQATVIANITVIIKEIDFISSMSMEAVYETTPYNGSLFSSISESFFVSAPEIKVSGSGSSYKETYNQNIVLYVDSIKEDKFTAVYNPEDGTIVGTPTATFSHWDYVGYSTTSDKQYKEVTKLIIQLRSLEIYSLVFERAFILQKLGLMASVDIGTIENKQLVFSPSTYGIASLVDGKLTDAKAVQYKMSNISEDSRLIQIYVTKNNSALVYFKPDGIIQYNKLLYYKSFSVSSKYYDIVFIYNDIEYTLHLDKSEAIVQDLIYTCTDIRTGETTEVYKRTLDDIVMFVKQFWSNTVDTENFWWVDSEHVLELAKNEFILHKKIGSVSGILSLHDWNGDNWEAQAKIKRSGLISTEDLYYSVTSAYNTSGVLFKLSNASSKIKVSVIDPLTVDWDKPAWGTVFVDVEKVALTVDGTALSHNSIDSYGPLNIDSLITTSKISSTVILTQSNKRKLLIGIKQNNGLGQWCLYIDISSTTPTLSYVIIGYGCVGHNGNLTGGQIPIDYCGKQGFNGTVKHLDALPARIGNINSVPTIIVGTASQQWFIQARMTGIVSHLTFDTAAAEHVCHKLYLNNNVDARCDWATYRGARLQDLTPQTLNIATLFGVDNPALAILFGVITPSIWYFNIFYAIFVGIVAAMGSYSYTWRNSIETKTRDAEKVTDQEISFAKFELNQSRFIDNRGMHVWAQIVVHMVQGLPETIGQVVVNKSQGQSAVDDSVGRKFSQLFEDSVASSVATAIDSSGFNVRAQSIIKHQHSLTSFYSINDKIECHAGPGFVNHNLKAQCTAQSTQDLQIDGKQFGFFSMLTALTRIVLGEQIAILEATYELLKNTGESTSQQSITATVLGSGTTINWGYFAGLAISAGMIVTSNTIKLNRMVYENIEAIGEAFGGKPAAYLNNWISAHTPSIEGLHSYGNKSMSFFWPAFGVNTPITYTNEQVSAAVETVDIAISLTGKTGIDTINLDESSNSGLDFVVNPFIELATLPIIKCYGSVVPDVNTNALDTAAPDNMAVIEGTTAFLSKTPFKNEQIGVGPPVFGPPMIHDFMIDSKWSLGYTAGAGEIISVSCDDTKLIDGPPSNVVITDNFCGIASSYVAIEVKDSFDKMYLRPTMVTTNTIGLNINRINCVHDAKAYHAFDGQVNRIVNWTGGSGLDKELLYQQYLFQMNDHFKRSNIFPPAQFYGNFQGPPTVAIRSYEIVSNTIVELTSGIGFGTSTPGENRNLQRFSTCVFSELLSSLPTTVRTLAPYKLRVNDGVTCLVTELRNTNTRYKAPTSIDFNIGMKLYRKTEEYVVEITEQSGVVMTETRTPSAGLEFIGPTMIAAYFYSPATKLYYEYAGGTELVKKDILNRFRNVREGRWDFINQEIIFNAQHGYTGAEMILRLDGEVTGEVWPPNKTIYNERSGFKIYSCAGGLVYQGPKRFIVSRFVTLEHMIPDIKRNKRRWKKVPSEEFMYERDYGWEYEDLYTDTPVDAVYGWTHNPFLVVTSMYGTNEDTDNKFEWSLTFAWSETMDHIFEQNEYVTVNVMAETVTQGGVLRQRPTHIYLSRDVFTRSDNAGYYTIKFQSNNGTGNRERLFIWSDGINALEDLKVALKQISASRTQPLITQVDLERLIEL